MPKFYEAPTYTEDEIIEMEEKDMKFPFSSKYMKYDSVKRQYIPTEALLLKHNIKLSGFLISIGENPQTKVSEELEYISDQVYAYINKSSGSNIETLKWIIAKGVRRGITPFRFRVMFEEILWKQARFYVNNDDLTKTTGVDIEQKQWISKGVMNIEDRQIDPKVKISLMDLGLCWVGSYDRQFLPFTTRNDW